MKEFSVTTPHEFTSVIEHLLSLPAPSSSAQTVTLTGDLGAGKTTFTQQLAHYLGITELVVSPTFVIMKSYEIPNHTDYDQLVHIDAYRFEDESEAGPLRLEEVFQTPRTLVCLEWPERVAGKLPTDRINVSIEITTGEERMVTVQS